MDYEKRVQQAMREIVQAGLAESAHDVSDGGLAVALAECSFGGAGVGAELELDSPLRPEFLLFHEGPSRILLSTARPEDVAAVAARHGVEAPVVGSTVEGRAAVRNRGTGLIGADIESLKTAYEDALERHLR
jgi:phosphoribosylformylglycinamidine synthase